MRLFDYFLNKTKLLQMAKQDQKLRKNPNSSLKEVEIRDVESTKKLKNIISKIGWPTISKVGEKAAHASWLLAQHTRDDEFRERCLELMKENLNGVSKKDVAFLEDRVCLKKYGYQIYGTQVKSEEKDSRVVTELLPIKDLDNLRGLRENMGLDTIEEQIRRCEKIYLECLKDKN